MAWIESHQNLRNHPKVHDLMAAMGWNLNETIGILHRFWWWCLDYAEDGDLRKHNDARIAAAVGLNGDVASIFVKNLVKSCWIDLEPYYRVHDWWDYIGFWLKARYGQQPYKWMRIRNAYIEGKEPIPDTFNPTMKMSEWSKLVRDRDDHTCQKCGDKNEKIHAHHIKPQEKFPSLMFSIENGISLCSKCHKAIYGKEHLHEEEFLRKVMKVTGKSPESITNQPNQPNQPNLIRSTFDDFWKTYPKKIAKITAERAWRKLNPNEQTQLLILAAISRAKTSEDWAKENGRYIPHPATYLNQRRWEDSVEITKLKPNKGCSSCGGSGYSPGSGRKCYCWK